MTEAIVVAIITGTFAVVSQLLIARQNSKGLYSELDKRSEISDVRLTAKIEQMQKVWEVKTDELTRETRAHNEFGQRIPVIEEKIAAMDKRLTEMEKRP